MQTGATMRYEYGPGRYGSEPQIARRPGATAEDEKNFGKGLVLTVIPETIVIFGLVMAILLWLNI